MSGASIIQYVSLLAVGLLWLGGCGGKGPTVATAVAGKVSYRGKLLGTGNIVFVPDGKRGTTGQPLCAAIAPDGGYKLAGDPTADVPPGWYRVTVAAVGIASPAPGQSFGVPYSLLPDKFRDPELSGLSCEVKPGKENAINFNLE